MRSVRENIAPNPLVQGLKHLASVDGASAWWFAKVDNITPHPSYTFSSHFPVSGADWEFHWWQCHGMHWGCNYGRFCPLCDHAGHQVPYTISMCCSQVSCIMSFAELDLQQGPTYNLIPLCSIKFPSGSSTDLSSLVWCSTVAARNREKDEKNKILTFLLCGLINVAHSNLHLCFDSNNMCCNKL